VPRAVISRFDKKERERDFSRESEVKRISGIAASAIVIMALSACGGGGGGGGGDGGGTPESSAPQAKTYSRAEVQGLARIGVSATVLTGRMGLSLVNFLGSVFESFSADTEGSRVIARPVCKTGAATAENQVRTPA